MAISDTEVGGRDWYAVRLRILDEQPVSGKPVVVRLRDSCCEWIALADFLGRLSAPIRRWARANLPGQRAAKLADNEGARITR